jgi:pimeloyl-ACP methyl ester carboxylesterase
MSQESVTSNDCTPIAYWRSGEGPPLVLVHGISADHSRWKPVLPAFEGALHRLRRRAQGALFGRCCRWILGIR